MNTYIYIYRPTNWVLRENPQEKSKMKEIVNRKLYDTDTADIVADDKYWDGHNWDRQGRNMTLYKTKKGAFFTHHETRWATELDSIIVVDLEEAKNMWERLPNCPMSWETAFEELVEIA